MTLRTYDDLVNEVEAWLEGILKDGMDARRYAEALVAESSPSYHNTIHVEVRGYDAKHKNPVTSFFDNYDDENNNSWWRLTSRNHSPVLAYGTREELEEWKKDKDPEWEATYIPWSDAIEDKLDEQENVVILNYENIHTS